jgi:TonB family protein
MKGKFKIMKTRPGITDDDIRSYMDFDKLLYKKDTTALKNKFLRNGGIVLTILIIAGLVLYVARVSDQKQLSGNTSIEQNSRIIPADSTAQEQSPGLIDTALTTTDDTIQVLPETSQQKKSESLKPENAKIKQREKDQHKADPQEKNQIIYVQAEPVDGYPALYTYFQQELTYPEAAVKDSIQGIVTVTFAISTEGRADKIKIENSLGPLFDAEVHRIITAMPLWKPATYNGKPVESKMSLPLTFELKKLNH